MQRRLLSLAALLLSFSYLNAQNVGINSTGHTPDPSTILDLNTGNTFGIGTSKGLLVPNVALTGPNDGTTIIAPAVSLLVYVPLGSGLNPPGYYYNSGLTSAPIWTQIGTGGGGGSGWLLAGNAGATPGANFLGTTDGNALEFKVDNQQAGWIDYSTNRNTFLGYEAGNTGLGTWNTALGYEALQNNTATGELNTALGVYSLESNSTGVNNTAAGTFSLNSNTSGYNNTAVGGNALAANLSGNENTGIGAVSLAFNTSGIDNTAVGMSSLYSNTTGSDNTAVGRSALLANKGGSGNTAVGDSTLAANTTGTQNTAVGYEALATNIVLSGNVAIGDSALYSQSNSSAGNTGNVAIGNSALFLNNPNVSGTGINNTAVGQWALRYNSTGYENTAIGFQSLYSNTKGSTNNAEGYYAMEANTTGSNNAAFGPYALMSNTSGFQNEAVGQFSLRANTTGYDNAAFGEDALYSNLTGLANTATGNRALFSSTTGWFNTACGMYALQSNTSGSASTGVGHYAGYNSTGSQNTFVGDSAGYINVAGTDNTIIGYKSDLASASLTNATALGNGAVAPVSNSVTLGNTAAVSLYLPGYSTVGEMFYTSAATGLVQGISPGTTGYVLQTNGAGAAPTWVPAGGGASGWSITGNTGTTVTANWMGTNDDNDVVFKRNGVIAGWLNNAHANVAWGVKTLNPTTNTIGSNNSALGFNALTLNTTGTNNTAIGTASLHTNNVGQQNTAVGVDALVANSNGGNNVGLGALALGANTTASSSTALGTWAGYNSTGSFNTFAGDSAGAYVTSGVNNVALGYGAGAVETTGSNNTYIGYNANPSAAGFTNAMALGNGAIVAASNAVVLGNHSVTQFQFNGALMPYNAGYSAGTAGQVLTSQGPLVAPKWANTSGGSGWALLGNAGITQPATPVTYGSSTFGAAENFLGTTDAKDLTFGTNNIERMRIVSGGNLGVGIATPSSELEVMGPGAVSNFGPKQTATGLLVATNACGYDLQGGIMIGECGHQAPGPNGWSFDLIGNNVYYNSTTDKLKFFSDSGSGYLGCVAITLNGDGLNNSIGTRLGFWGGVNKADPTEVMSVFASGDVGIGTTAPKNKLDVTGSAAIGSYAGVTAAPANGLIVSGNVGIGCSVPNYQLQVGGNMGVNGTIFATAASVSAGVLACSDIRYKKNIVPLKNSLQNIMKIQGVNYNWRTNEFPDKHFTDAIQVGFIAQALEKVYPEMVFTDDKGYKSVDYSRLTPILVEGMKEQQGMIDSLKLANRLQEAKLDNQQNINKTQTAKIDNLQQQMTELKKLVYTLTEKAEVGSAKAGQ